MAYYFHWALHCLNLSASAAVKVSAISAIAISLTIQNAENVARKVVKMSKNSAKKIALLKSSITEDVSSQGKTKRYLVGLCETRLVERHASIPMKHSKLGAKDFNKVCPKTVQNALKWPLQYVSFEKFSGKACPRTLWSFLFVFQLASNQFCRKKLRLKNIEMWGPFLKKNSNYASDMKHFERTYLRSFPRLDVYRFYIYSSKHSN